MTPRGGRAFRNALALAASSTASAISDQHQVLDTLQRFRLNHEKNVSFRNRAEDASQTR